MFQNRALLIGLDLNDNLLASLNKFRAFVVTIISKLHILKLQSHSLLYQQTF